MLQRPFHKKNRFKSPVITFCLGGLIFLLATCKSITKSNGFKPIPTTTTNQAVQNSLQTELNIDSICERIDSNTLNSACMEFDLFGQSAEGASVRIWYNNAVTSKITADFYGETGAKRYIYYVWENNPIRVKDIEYLYDQPITQGNVKTDSVVTIINLGGTADNKTEYLQTYRMLLDSSQGIELRSCN